MLKHTEPTTFVRTLQYLKTIIDSILEKIEPRPLPPSNSNTGIDIV